MSVNEEQKNILKLVGKWLEASSAPGNADQRLIIERTGFVKIAGEVTHVQYTIRAEILMGSSNVPITTVVQMEQPLPQVAPQVSAKNG